MNELLVVTPNGYKTSKLYSVVPANGTGDLTWVRNTTATRVNSSGLIESVGANVPRLDYTGGVTCPCILVEPLRTNSLLRSEEINNASWTKLRVSISNDTTISPDGLTTADTITADGTSGFHYFLQASSVTSGSTYTCSLFVKAGTQNFIQVIQGSAPFGSSAYCNFNVSTGIIGTVGATALNPFIENYGNGWYRIGFSAVALSTGSSNFFPLFITSNTSVFLESNTLNTSLYVWGVQLEEGSSVSSYIPTTSSIQTRNADVATVTTPVGITSLIETYEDNTTNVVNPIPVTYQMSEGRIAKVVGL